MGGAGAGKAGIGGVNQRAGAGNAGKGRPGRTRVQRIPPSCGASCVAPSTACTGCCLLVRCLQMQKHQANLLNYNLFIRTAPIFPRWAGCCR